MNLVYGTLGFNVDNFSPVLRALENVEKVILFYGFIDEDSQRMSNEAREEIHKECKERNILTEMINLKDPFDFVEITKTIKKQIEKDQKKDTIITFNISGGTKPMVAAALLACIFNGIPTQYIHEKTLQVIPIPLLQMKYSKNLTPTEHKIINFILDSEKKLTVHEIADHFNRTNSTLSVQLHELVKKGILIFEPGPNLRTKYVLPSKGIELLLR